MTDHKDARQLLADITAGLERLDQAPWEVSHQNGDPEGGFRGVVSPHKTNRLGKQYRCYVAQYCSPDMAEHIARCDPDNMQTIDREFAALTLELASAKRRIAELEAERQWQPIETAPKDSNVILGVTITEGGETWSHVAQGKWIDGEEDQVDQPGRDAGFVDNEYCCFHPGRSFGPEKYQYSGLQPTHWMPLPASPHEGTRS